MQQSNDEDDDIQKGNQMIIASVQYTSRTALEKVTQLERENEQLLNSINKNNQLKQELLRTIQKAEETLRLYEVQGQQLDQFTVSNNNTILPSKQQRKKSFKSTRNHQQKQQPTIPSSTTTNKRMKPLPNDDTEINNRAKEIDALEFVMELWDELYDQDGNIYTEYDSDESKRNTWFQVLEQHHDEFTKDACKHAMIFRQFRKRRDPVHCCVCRKCEPIKDRSIVYSMKNKDVAHKECLKWLVGTL
jgi:hypothetical protein